MEDGWQLEAAERSGGRSQQEFKGECLNALPANRKQTGRRQCRELLERRAVQGTKDREEAKTPSGF